MRGFLLHIVIKLLVNVTDDGKDQSLDSSLTVSCSGGKKAFDVMTLLLGGDWRVSLHTILLNAVLILVLRKMYSHGLMALLA